MIMTKPLLSVVIPVYNEENRIIPTLQHACEYLSQQDLPWELIVVSDGSSDRTVACVKPFQNSYPTVKIIENTENHGKGAVVKQGMLAAHGDLRLFMDADSSTPI